jgi:hypothetical protein
VLQPRDGPYADRREAHGYPSPFHKAQQVQAVRFFSETVPARMPALAIWISAIVSCGLNSMSGLRSNF